jgi:hypothetical protein
MGHHNLRDGKYPDAMLNDFRELLDNMPDAMHPVTIYNSLQEFLKHKSHNNTCISDKQLHVMDLSIYHGIKVQVEG